MTSAGYKRLNRPSEHKWVFRRRFRPRAFGWRSQPAIQRIREAVSEITQAARHAPVPGAEGAVQFLERVSPALEQVDSSSGAVGTAVNNAIEKLSAIIAAAPADLALRDHWLERLFQALEDDDIPYIEILPEYWGDLCGTPEMASRWADRLIQGVRMAWSPDPELRGYFKGTNACLSALLKAGRHQEILDLLALSPRAFWDDRRWGVKALAAMGKKEEALRYAEDSRRPNAPSIAISSACEEILLATGMREEAYGRYAIEANQKPTYIATFRAIVKKYPHKTPRDILSDLVASAPGEEGKWFAAAKSAGLYAEAIELANRTPCDPKTLIRAARDEEATEPRFAIEAGLAALRWLAEGYGYEITPMDVRAAYDHMIRAARNAGCESETLQRIRKLIGGSGHGRRWVAQILGRDID
jgi:hypothetical protein